MMHYFKNLSMIVLNRLNGKNLKFIKNETSTNFRVAFSSVLITVLFAVLPGVNWNTFLGGTGFDESRGIAVDGSGNTYVIGFSESDWGSPLNGHAGGYDTSIAKINSNGVRAWHTFLGGTAWDFGEDIVLDSNGNIYVTGTSTGTWGTPLQAFAGLEDAYVAKFNSNGSLQWSTFLGGGNFDDGYGIALDGSGNVYVTGVSAGWGTPLNPHGGAVADAFVAKLDNNGVLQWHTFLGGGGMDEGFAIHVTLNGDIFITGESDSNWGTPINPHHADSDDDVFVAKLNTSGALQWHTFMGGEYGERGEGIHVEGNGTIYVTGFTWWGWGTPINPYGGGLTDAFVAKFNGSGMYQWHTFLGGSEDETGHDLTGDGAGNIYVTGYSSSTWGTPINPFAGHEDTFVAQLNGNGIRLYNTFLGGSGVDAGYSIFVRSDKVYVTGNSSASWGNPVVAHTDGNDIFVARVNFPTTSTFKSVGSQDGWVLESTESSGAGGAMNSIAATFNLGDDAADRQYRAILSFNTSSLPDNAIITKVTLKVKKNGVVGGGNPLSIFQGFKVDIKNGTFGNSALETGDFKAIASKTYGPFNPSLSASGWYSLNLTSGKGYVNKIGNTQIRLYFSLDDNNNNIANILRLYSGNAGALNVPQLVIQYYIQ